ncbi:MAG: recombinase family protein, partial [Synergistaceae bacterium]|nr:recombinase family protein [Synergistaceae bacterium]
MGRIRRKKAKITRVNPDVNPDINSSQSSSSSPARFRVAVYCRMSGPFDEAAGIDSSVLIENNYLHVSAMYNDLIKNHSDRYSGRLGSSGHHTGRLGQWTLGAIYADIGLTRVQFRPKFFEMMRDAQSRFFDILLCKPLRMFSHDMEDAVEQIRKLMSWGIRLIFEYEGFDTESYVADLLLTVLDSFAQEGKERDEPFEPVYGYRLVNYNGSSDNGGNGFNNSGQHDFGHATHCVIVQEEAAVIKGIFYWYEHGCLPSEIVNTLIYLRNTNDEIAKILEAKTPAWNEDEICSIIQDERYVGDLATVANHHKAIIHRKQFDRCDIILDMKDLYPFGSLLRCPYCGHSLKQRFVFDGIHFLCEGDGACRRFVIPAEPIRDAILKAWKDINLRELRKLFNEMTTISSVRAGSSAGDRVKSRAQAIAANEIRLLIEEKKKNPVFDEVDYWWLDKYVLRITFGRHENRQQPAANATANTINTRNSRDGSNDSKNGDNSGRCLDDRTIIIYWKCGITSTLPSGQQTQEPQSKARLWDDYIITNANIYPDLAAEAVSAMFTNMRNAT